MTPYADLNHLGSGVLSRGVQSLLAGIDSVADADDESLEQLLADAEAAVNMLQAAQADAMIALEARAREADAVLPATVAHLASRREEGVVDQIALALRFTRAAATHRYQVARHAHQHSALLESWRIGAIDQRKVAVIGEGLEAGQPLNDDTLLSRGIYQLAAEASSYAAEHTAPQIKA